MSSVDRGSYSSHVIFSECPDAVQDWLRYPTSDAHYGVVLMHAIACLYQEWVSGLTSSDGVLLLDVPRGGTIFAHSFVEMMGVRGSGDHVLTIPREVVKKARESHEGVAQIAMQLAAHAQFLQRKATPHLVIGEDIIASGNTIVKLADAALRAASHTQHFELRLSVLVPSASSQSMHDRELGMQSRINVLRAQFPHVAFHFQLIAVYEEKDGSYLTAVNNHHHDHGKAHQEILNSDQFLELLDLARELASYPGPLPQQLLNLFVGA